MKLGAMIESFQLPLEDALATCASLHLGGVQIYARYQERDLISMSARQRADLLKMVRDNGLEFSAVCGDLGGHGFQDKAGNPERIELSKKIVDLCCDLGTRVMTTHIGVVPTSNSSLIYAEMVETARKVGEYAAANGVTLAIETGPEPATRLRDFLQDVNSPGCGVNFDPANLAMVVRDKTEEAASILAPWIVHVHAKDGINLRQCNPADVYGSLETADLTPAELITDPSCPYLEVPLGQGDVDWEGFIRVLRKNNYHGFLTIERECGETPVNDIRMAAEFLRNKLSVNDR